MICVRQSGGREYNSGHRVRALWNKVLILAAALADLEPACEAEELVQVNANSARLT
jgi:hypothetical protein